MTLTSTQANFSKNIINRMFCRSKTLKINVLHRVFESLCILQMCRHYHFLSQVFTVADAFTYVVISERYEK
jgi:hypothetical protein